MLMRELRNWQTTIAGFVLALAYYLHQNGGKFPETWEEWQAALISTAVAYFGIASKDATTGSEPPTIMSRLRRKYR